MPNKTFDLILRSKYTPKGVKGALADLKSIGEVGTFIKFGLVQPLEQAGRVLFDFIGAANPDRIKRFAAAFDNLKFSVGQAADRAFGPLLDQMSDVVNRATLLSNIKENLDPIYQGIIAGSQAAGKSAREMADEIKGASDSAIAAANAQNAATNEAAKNNYFNQFMKMNNISQVNNPLAVDVSQVVPDSEKMKGALLAVSRTSSEYISAMMRAGISVKDFKAEIERFNAAKGIVLKPPDMAPVFEALKSGLDKMQSLQMDNAIQGGRFLQDLATRNYRAGITQDIQNARQREQLKRQNTETLSQIDRDYGKALAQSTKDLAKSLAEIDQSSADQRFQIEQSYQYQVQTIQQSSQQSIDDAIANRDAGALTRAVNQRGQQLADAKHGRDEQLAAEAKATAERKAQAQQQAAEQRAAALQQADDQRIAAQQAWQGALDEMKRANKEARDDQTLQNAWAIQDQHTANQRKVDDLIRSNNSELVAEQNKYDASLRYYRQHLNDVVQTTKDWTTASQFGEMVDKRVIAVIDQFSASRHPAVEHQFDGAIFDLESNPS